MKTTIFLALLLGLGLGCIINHEATKTASAEVYAVCNSARLELDGRSEQRCGDLQDRYQIEFLCESNNQLISNHCWTEAK